MMNMTIAELKRLLSDLPDNMPVVIPVIDEDDCNHKILEQYLKVLGYAVTNTIDANVNKIKVYGGQFAELLPYLIF